MVLDRVAAYLISRIPEVATLPLKDFKTFNAAAVIHLPYEFWIRYSPRTLQPSIEYLRQRLQNLLLWPPPLSTAAIDFKLAEKYKRP